MNFLQNFMVIEAGLYDIQVIGEAVSKLPEDVRQNEQQIPLVLIKGMRNRLIHEYFGTDLNLVWNVIKNELPSFDTDLKKIHRINKSKQVVILKPDHHFRLCILAFNEAPISLLMR